MTGIRNIESKEDFDRVLELPKAIIYFLVNWSGPERFSRNVVYQAWSELKCDDFPIFQIDCSDQEKKYVEDWLTTQKQNIDNFYRGGYGETVLTWKGTMMDFIRNPAQLGLEGTKKTIARWVGQICK